MQRLPDLALADVPELHRAVPAARGDRPAVAPPRQGPHRPDPLVEHRAELGDAHGQRARLERLAPGDHQRAGREIDTLAVAAARQVSAAALHLDQRGIEGGGEAEVAAAHQGVGLGVCQRAWGAASPGPAARRSARPVRGRRAYRTCPSKLTRVSAPSSRCVSSPNCTAAKLPSPEVRQLVSGEQFLSGLGRHAPRRR